MTPTPLFRIGPRRVILALTALATAGCGDAPPARTAGFHTAPAVPPPAGSLFLHPERIPLEAGGFAHAERGLYFAPLNRSDPETAVVAVELYRFPASDAADPDTPPIFYLHGGPSFDGLERELEEPGNYERRWQAMTDVADVVVVGQRGIGSSRPTTLVETTVPPPASGEPYTEDELAERYVEVLEAERAFWEEAGLDLAGYTVVEMASDVDEIRAALGYDRITLWGGSFGSHWAMTLMRSRPEIVARAILRGMEGPDHTYDHPGHLWNVYRRVGEEAETLPEFRGRIPEGGLVAAFEALVARAEAAPFSVLHTDAEGRSHEVRVDGDAVRSLARGFTRGPAGWPADVVEMVEGDFSRAAAELHRRASDGGRDFRTASYFQLDCGSGITPARLEEMLADPANDVLHRMNWGYRVGCRAWDSDLGDEFRQNFDTEIPTLIAHGTWDTSTPYENALELIPHFLDSKFVPVIRGPHGAITAAMQASEPFRDGVLRFAETGDWGSVPDTVWIEQTFRAPTTR